MFCAECRFKWIKQITTARAHWLVLGAPPVGAAPVARDNRKLECTRPAAARATADVPRVCLRRRFVKKFARRLSLMETRQQGELVFIKLYFPHGSEQKKSPRLFCVDLIMSWTSLWLNTDSATRHCVQAEGIQQKILGKFKYLWALLKTSNFKPNSVFIAARALKL